MSVIQCIDPLNELCTIQTFRKSIGTLESRENMYGNYAPMLSLVTKVMNTYRTEAQTFFGRDPGERLGGLRSDEVKHTYKIALARATRAPGAPALPAHMRRFLAARNLQ